MKVLSFLCILSLFASSCLAILPERTPAVGTPAVGAPATGTHIPDTFVVTGINRLTQLPQRFVFLEVGGRMQLVYRDESFDVDAIIPFAVMVNNPNTVGHLLLHFLLTRTEVALVDAEIDA